MISMVTQSDKRSARWWLVGLLLTIGLPGHAADGYPYPGIISTQTDHDFDVLWQRLDAAIKANEMLVVSRASASRAAKTRGID
ncbi:MAG: hypothetical protein OES46_20615, partial [Gammaproteobacteria bacterium]|nr:hypothetical protein [Gammaproteobacteria bacterium]